MGASQNVTPQAHDFTAHDGYHCDFTARKPIILNAVTEVGTPASTFRDPVSLLDIYQQYEPDLSTSLTPWVLAMFDLEREGLIQTWTRNHQTYIELTDLGMRRVLMGSETPGYDGDQGDENDAKPSTPAKKAARKGRAA